MRLEGKVALVTGAGRGIGRAIALTFAREGADIIVNDINLSDVEEVAREVRALGRKSLPVKADISSITDINRMVQEAVEEFQRIDILVNNAGICPLTEALNVTEELWDKALNTNLKGTFLVSQTVAREMIKQKRGLKIVNIASIAGRIASPMQIVYSASKAGIHALTRSLGVEWARYNINVNSVSPGLTETDMAARVRREQPDVLQGYIDRIPRKRTARPEEIAYAVLFLASAESDHITGQDITVDGGVTVIHPGTVRVG